MSNKNLTILGIVAIAMVALAVLQSHRAREPVRKEQGAPAYLIQGLNMDNVQRISAKTTTDTTVLKRIQGRFFVTNKENYPASTSKVNELITKVLDVRALEKVTSNPENFVELGLDPNSAKSVVKFMDQKDKLITGLVISDSQGGQTHVRLLPTNDVYATGPIPWMLNAPMDFIEDQVLDIQDNDVQSVTVSDPNETYTLIYDPNNNRVTLDQPIPQGKKLKEADSKTVIRALSRFRITDAMRQASAEKNLKFDQTYSCLLKNSAIYTIKIARRNGESFVKCSVEFTKESKVYIDENESEEMLKKKEEQLLAGDAALEFNNNHESWIYKIAEYKTNEMTKKLDDLLEDLPEELTEPELAEPNEPSKV
jgi:hypothetical protein